MSKGKFGIHGGQFVPETLMNAVNEFEEAYEKYKNDPEFVAELDTLMRELPGRPLLYGTTENFLRCFNISSLDELPPLPEGDEDKESEENGEEQEKTENGNEQIDLLADQPVDRQ